MNLSISSHKNSNLVFNFINFCKFTFVFILMNFIFCKATFSDSYLCPTKLSSLFLNVAIAFINYGNFVILDVIIDEKRVQLHADKVISLFIYLLLCFIYLFLSFQGILNNFSLQKNPLELLMLLSVIFHTFSYSSSSFIEEEHQTWYYFSNSLFIIFFINSVRKHVNCEVDLSALNISCSSNVTVISKENTANLLRWNLFFLVHLFLRRLNQTGDKWINVSDIGDWLNLPENKLWLSWLMGIGRCCIYIKFFFLI